MREIVVVQGNWGLSKESFLLSYFSPPIGKQRSRTSTARMGHGMTFPDTVLTRHEQILEM